jgi:hypothetical protein
MRNFHPKRFTCSLIVTTALLAFGFTMFPAQASPAVAVVQSADCGRPDGKGDHHVGGRVWHLWEVMWGLWEGRTVHEHN